MAAVRSLVQLLRQRPATADALLALVLVALAQLEIWTLQDLVIPRLVLALTSLVSLGALAWRRRAPLASALVALGALAVGSAFWRLDGTWIVFAMLVPVYSVARHRDTGSALIAAVLALAAAALGTAQEPNENFGQFLGNYLFIVVLVICTPW